MQIQIGSLHLFRHVKAIFRYTYCSVGPLFLFVLRIFKLKNYFLAFNFDLYYNINYLQQIQSKAKAEQSLKKPDNNIII